MRTHPPIRSAILLVGLASALALTSCVTPVPSPSIPGLPTSSPDSSSTTEGLDGLLVVAGGALQVTDQDGSLVPLAGPPNPVDVSAGGATTLIVDASRTVWIADARALRSLEAPDTGGRLPLAAMAPDGSAIAYAIGAPQGLELRLEVQTLDAIPLMTIRAERGLDGPPVWLGPATVAVHTFGKNGQATFTLFDVTAGTSTDASASGIALSASADGRRVAVDDQASGDVFVGPRVDWQASGIDGFARIEGHDGAGVERLAMSASGRRLAIVFRSDQGASVEVQIEVDGTWRSAGSVAIEGDGAVAVAWRE